MWGRAQKTSGHFEVKQYGSDKKKEFFREVPKKRKF